MRCAMVLLDALLDPNTVALAAHRVAIAKEFELARVMAVSTKRCEGDFAASDHATAISAHVELILEAMWRDEREEREEREERD